MWLIAAAFSLFLIWPLLYGIAIPVVLLGGDFAPIGEVLVAMLGTAAVYTFGITSWGLPYALFAILFLSWSRNKSIKMTSLGLICSPIIIAFMAVAVVMLLWLFPRFAPRIIQSLEGWQKLQVFSFRTAIICLVYGYILVGGGAVGYRLLDHFKFFKSETEAPQNMSGADTNPLGNHSTKGMS